jgi:MFS family permease
MFEALKYRDFRWIWIGQTAHAFALWAQIIALPLLVLEITDNSASQLGAVVAVRVVPTLLLGPWAGVVADWFDRRSILIVTKWNNLLLSIAISALVVTGEVQLWHVYLWVFLRGATQVFDQPARYSMIPDILPERLVTQAMALLSSTQNIMRIAGAAGAGIIAEYLGLSWTFSIIAVSAAGGLFATYLIQAVHHPPTGDHSLRAMTGGLIEGARYSISQPTIRGVLIVSLVYFTFGMSYMQVFAPLFAVEVLEIGRDGLGLMFALTGVGALFASLMIARIQPQRLGIILPLTVMGLGLGLFVFSLTSYMPRPAGLVLPLAILAVVGAFQTSFMALSRSVMLQAAPKHLRGRVMAFISLDRAMMAAGGAAGGFLSATYGIQPTQMVFGLLCALGGLAVFISLRDLRGFTATESIGQRRVSKQTGTD